MPREAEGLGGLQAMLEGLLGRQARTLSPRELATVLSATARRKEGGMDTEMMKELCGWAWRRADGFSPRDISLTLHALASLEWSDLGLVEKLCRVGLKRVLDFNLRDVATTLGALARLVKSRSGGEATPARMLCAELCELAAARTSSLNARDTAQTLSAVARLGVGGERTVERLCRRAA